MSHGLADARRPLGDVVAELSSDGRWAPWPTPIVIGTTPSTMAEAAALAERGAPEGTVVVAEEQTAGRGRAGREWQSLPFAGLWLTVVLRPSVDPASLGWLPLIAGAAAVRAIASQTGLALHLKWPNDIVAISDSALVKVGGILAERLGDGAVLVGIGINVDHGADELPPGGSSLWLLGRAAVSREALLAGLLGALASGYRAWLGGADPAPGYRDLCVTIGSDVRVEGPGRTLEGTASGLGRHGELLVTDRSGAEHVVSAGDVLLVRPANG